jgi:UDP-glucose 4-epimerase
MAVLVTGAAGFIGSNLVDELMTQGMQVLGLDDLSEGRLENLDRWRSHKNFQFIKGSILDYDLVRRAADNTSCIFHLAADSRIQTGISDPRHSVETNVMGTINVAEAARQAKVPRVVYSASSSAYGRANDWIWKKLEKFQQRGGTGIGAFRGFHEELPTDCLNPYSMSKKAGEDVMDVYNRLYGVSTCALRYFNVYGPRHQEEGRYSTVIAIFRRQLRRGQRMTIVGDGTQRRDFTFVGDVVRANMLAMMNRDATGVFNIGTGVNHSINELALRIAGKEPVADGHALSDQEWQRLVEYIPPRMGEAELTLADSTKAREAFGWSPQVSLSQGLEVLDKYERKMGVGSSGIIVVGR